MTGDELKAARKRMFDPQTGKAWTQKQLGQALGFTPDAIIKMEKGRREITQATELAVEYLEILWKHQAVRKGKKD